MKILAAAFASCFLLAAPVFAQKPVPPAGDAAPPAGAAEEPAQAPPGTTPDKPVDEPEPTEAPPGTEPTKPAGDPQG